MGIRDAIAMEIENKDTVPCLKITLDHMIAGGNIDLGYSNYGTPTPADAKVIITADFNGFEDGQIVTHNLTFYPTTYKRKRFPDSPDEATRTPDSEISGDNYIIRLALNRYVYMNCTNIKATLKSGVYTDANGASNAVTDFSVTNNSAQGYCNTKGNWGIPMHGFRFGFNEFTVAKDDSGYKEVRVLAYNGDMVNGNGGIDCVKVTATGRTSGQTQTVDCVLDVMKLAVDVNAVPEYIGRIPYSIYTQNELVDIKPIIYPYIGETALDFSATGFTMPTGRPCVHTVVCDKNHTYGTSIAIVDPAAGAGASVVSLDAFLGGTIPVAYTTRGAAANALRTFNNTNYGRADLGGSIIYMKAANHVTVGAVVTKVANSCYCITTPYPGVTRAQVVFNSQASEWYIATTFEMMNNVSYAMGAVDLARNNQHFFYYNCDMQSGFNFHWSLNPAFCAVVGGNMTNLSQGLSPYNTYANGMFFRGITWSNTAAKGCKTDVLVGCNLLTSITCDNVGTTNYGVMHGQIIANNRFKQHTDVPCIFIETTTTNGPMIINNEMIQPITPDTATNTVIKIFGDASVNNPGNDFHIVYTTAVGARMNHNYNDSNLNGVGPASRILNSVRNCIMDMFNMITDVNTHAGDADGTRYGNHAGRHGTWISGNIGRFIVGEESHPAEAGHKCIMTTSAPSLDLKFIDDQSGRPGFTGSGTGNYRLQSSSPALNAAYDYLFKYDLNGDVRNSVNGSSGCYECSSTGSHKRRMKRTLSVLDYGRRKGR